MLRLRRVRSQYGRNQGQVGGPFIREEEARKCSSYLFPGAFAGGKVPTVVCGTCAHFGDLLQCGYWCLQILFVLLPTSLGTLFFVLTLVNWTIPAHHNQELYNSFTRSVCNVTEVVRRSGTVGEVNLGRKLSSCA